jgi:hypothetical protein
MISNGRNTAPGPSAVEPVARIAIRSRDRVWMDLERV